MVRNAANTAAVYSGLTSTDRIDMRDSGGNSISSVNGLYALISTSKEANGAYPKLSTSQNASIATRADDQNVKTLSTNDRIYVDGYSAGSFDNIVLWRTKAEVDDKADINSISCCPDWSLGTLATCPNWTGLRTYQTNNGLSTCDRTTMIGFLNNSLNTWNNEACGYTISATTANANHTAGTWGAICSPCRFNSDCKPGISETIGTQTKNWSTSYATCYDYVGNTNTGNLGYCANSIRNAQKCSQICANRGGSDWGLGTLASCPSWYTGLNTYQSNNSLASCERSTMIGFLNSTLNNYNITACGYTISPVTANANHTSGNWWAVCSPCNFTSDCTKGFASETIGTQTKTWTNSYSTCYDSAGSANSGNPGYCAQTFSTAQTCSQICANRAGPDWGLGSLATCPNWVGFRAYQTNNGLTTCGRSTFTGWMDDPLNIWVVSGCGHTISTATANANHSGGSWNSLCTPCNFTSDCPSGSQTFGTQTKNWGVHQCFDSTGANNTGNPGYCANNFTSSQTCSRMCTNTSTSTTLPLLGQTAGSATASDCSGSLAGEIGNFMSANPSLLCGYSSFVLWLNDSTNVINVRGCGVDAARTSAQLTNSFWMHVCKPCTGNSDCSGNIVHADSTSKGSTTWTSTCYDASSSNASSGYCASSTTNALRCARLCNTP